MISDRALTALRCAAAVLHCTSGVRLRLSHGGVALFDICHPPCPEEVDHTVLPTCRFRAAVVRAHDEHRNGSDIAMCGLPHGVDPELSYGVRPTDRVLPGGALRLERDGLWLHVTAMARTEPSTQILVARLQHCDVQTLDDDALDVTVICIATEAGDIPGSAAALDDLGDLSARVAVAEIEAHLSTAAAG